ncbi:MAG: hypothetical protein M1818_000558 [Claussenomyces sp. TS43310]|nr:MAG: hypothetical protein M1818_000558 [Claussenomyces sp. TS43310]
MTEAASLRDDAAGFGADWGYNARWGPEPVMRDVWGGGHRFQGWHPAPQGFFPAPAGMEWFAPPLMPGIPVGLPAMPPPPAEPAYGGLPPAYPQPVPAPPPNDGGRPGMHVPNHLGGVGVPPGYSYLAPTENCAVHILGGDVPPWESQNPRVLEPFIVPTNTTIKDLMKGFGCDNLNPIKNVLTEVTQAGNGVWKRGLEIKGNNIDRMKKTIGEMGWTKERNGRDEDFVWLWLQKD